MDLTGKDFLSIADVSAAQLRGLFELAAELKANPRGSQPLAGRVLAMIFEKPSLRTRVSFETGMIQLGGQAIYLAPSDISLGKRESVGDVAVNLSRMTDGIMARVFEHDKVVQLAAGSEKPVINGLSDLEHPCQALADYLTIAEHLGLESRPLLTYIGDGNNVCHSLMLTAQALDLPMRVACPTGFEPHEDYLRAAPSVEIVNDPAVAVAGADVVYTDVWASMGQEDSAAHRRQIFAPFQVNAQLMAGAKPDAIFMHCLPAHRDEEVAAEVIDGPRSVVFDQAENRLHAQKALLVALLA